MQASPYSQYFSQNFENQPMNVQLAVALKKVASLVNDAKEAIKLEKYDMRLEKIEHATKIILLLKDSLIESKVPEIHSMVNSINQFYQMILKLFDQIDLKNDIAYADQAITSLTGMAETWQNIQQNTLTPQMPTPEASHQVSIEISA